MKKMMAHATVIAKNTQDGLNLYLNMAGKEHYLVTRRHNGLIWEMLKSGMTVGELARVSPERDRQSQKKIHYAAHILKVVDDYINIEMAA